MSGMFRGMGLEKQIPVLMYHSVSDRTLPCRELWTISPAIFASHLEYLKTQGYHPLTVSALVSILFDKQGQLPDKPVAITFDDGLGDFYTGALPVLDRYGFPASLYIPTAYVGLTRYWLDPCGELNYPMLSWSEVHEIVAHGIECGTHGLTHTHLDILPRKKMEEEVRISKDILEQHLQQKVESMAYPYGLFSPTLQKIVRLAGYSSACAVKHSMMSIDGDRYSIGRISITSDLTQAGFQNLLAGKGLRKSYKHERIITKAFRGYRRLKLSLNLF